MVQVIKISDMVDPNDPAGRSYREVNLEKKHNIPVGQLVELKSGVRMFVACQSRDCDGTPLYSLTSTEGDYIQHEPRRFNRNWDNGYPEESLKPVTASSSEV